MLTSESLECQAWKPSRLLPPLAWARQKTSIKRHNIESKSVTGPWNILFASLYVCTFHSPDVLQAAAVKGLRIHFKAKRRRWRADPRYSMAWICTACQSHVTGPNLHAAWQGEGADCRCWDNACLLQKHLSPFLHSLAATWLVGWLNSFNTELSPKRYWRGPRSREVGEEGDFTYRYTVITRKTPALRWAPMRAILMFHYLWGRKSQKTAYLSLHCHHQNDSCIKMGSDESHFNVSLIARDKLIKDGVHRPQLLKREENRNGIEPRSFCLPASRLTAR